MLLSPSPTIPFPAPSAGSSGELASTLVRAQMTMAGGLWRWSSESAGFMTARLQKDAEAMAILASTRSPTEAATLVMRHMQAAWADYAAHAMKLGAMMSEGVETEPESAAATVTPPQPETGTPAPQPRVPAAPAKATRSDPV